MHSTAVSVLVWLVSTWGSCRSPPRRRLRLFWKNEWISAFSMEVVRSMESSERALSSHRVREKVNATTGVCCLWDRKCTRVSHTARSWRGKKHRDENMIEKNPEAVKLQTRTEGNYLTRCSVLRSIFRSEWLSVFAGALLLGINSCIVPEQQTSFMRNSFGIFFCDYINRHLLKHHAAAHEKKLYPLVRKLPTASTSRNISFWVLVLFPVYR